MGKYHFSAIEQVQKYHFSEMKGDVGDASLALLLFTYSSI